MLGRWLQALPGILDLALGLFAYSAALMCDIFLVVRWLDHPLCLGLLGSLFRHSLVTRLRCVTRRRCAHNSLQPWAVWQRQLAQGLDLTPGTIAQALEILLEDVDDFDKPVLIDMRGGQL